MIRSKNTQNNRYSNKIVVNCNNGWQIWLDDSDKNIDTETYNQLKEFDEEIYWSGDMLDYYIMDFKINDIWFEIERMKNINEDKELFIKSY